MCERVFEMKKGERFFCYSLKKEKDPLSKNEWKFINVMSRKRMIDALFVLINVGIKFVFSFQIRAVVRNE